MDRGHLDDTRGARGRSGPTPVTQTGTQLTPGTWAATLRTAFSPDAVRRILDQYGASSVTVRRVARRKLALQFSLDHEVRLPAFVERYCEGLRRV